MEAGTAGASGAQRQSSPPASAKDKGRYRIGVESTEGGGLKTDWLAEAEGSDREKALDAALDGKTKEVFDREALDALVKKVDDGEKVDFVVVALARLAPVPVQITRRRRIG